MIMLPRFLLVCAVALAVAAPLRAADELPADDTIMKAMVTELQRSMELQLEDLEKPYFIQFTVDDSINYQIRAAYGSLIVSNRDRSRRFYCDVRVGSTELDNTNFAGGGGFRFFGGGGGGGQGNLPIEDDPVAMRQQMWWVTDQAYKNAVETLTRKRAYMKDKTFDERPHDFSKASIVEHVEPGVEVKFDQAAWEKNVQRLSARFNHLPHIQDSSVQLLVGFGNNHLANSEGTRVRTAQRGTLLVVMAETQAENGMVLSDSRTYTGRTVEDLPALEKIEADIDEMSGLLKEAMTAGTLEDHYAGPVLFDGPAAAQMFRSLLADGIAGEPEVVGSDRRSFPGSENLEKKLEQRILPKSFKVYDDPTVATHDGKPLFGHYLYDDEGVAAERVEVVDEGVLRHMLMSRTPTKKFNASNGHGRRPPMGSDVQAEVGCLFIGSSEGVSDDDLKAALIEAAKEEGLEFGLRIKAIRSPGVGASRSDLARFFMQAGAGGGGGTLGDPVYAYKVYVADGREEMVRGIQFGPVHDRALKRITAAGSSPYVYNYIGLGFGGATPPATIVAPPVLVGELELAEIEQEHDQRPLLPSPLGRETPTSMK